MLELLYSSCDNVLVKLLVLFKFLMFLVDTGNYLKMLCECGFDNFTAKKTFIITFYCIKLPFYNTILIITYSNVYCFAN